MQAYAVFAVNDHLEYLLADAARWRAVKRPGPSLKTRIAAFAASLSDLLEDAVATAPLRTPRAR